MENNNKEYYFIKDNKAMAMGLAYMLNENFFIFDDRFDKDKKVYSFKNTNKFKVALDLMVNFRKENLKK